MAGKERIGLVLSGGGARGAYEAGALSALLPELERRGERPSVFVGTSVGAINAAYLAASAHLSAEASTAGGLERWRDVTKGRVVRPILSLQVPLTALRYAGEIAGLPGVRLPSLLDPAPLQQNLPRWINWRRLHANTAERRVDSVAVVATGARSGRTVVFAEGRLAPRRRRRSHVLDFVATELAPDHVRASAAIPILFPAVHVSSPPTARGWYFDGGTRLNTPIKPALDLGVDRLVVIGTDSIEELPRGPELANAPPPDFGDGALHVLQGMLVDPVIEDLRILGNINVYYAEGNHAPQAEDYREARGKRPYRVVPYMFIGPQERGDVGRLAARVFRERYGGLKFLRSPDFPLLNRLLGGDSPTHGELLSYLFFDEEFIAELIDMGRRDALAWLESREAKDDPWQIEPLDAFLTRRRAARQPDR